MPTVKNLIVRAGADFSAITKQANKAKTSMRSMETSVSKSCSKMSASCKLMNKAFSAIRVAVSTAALVSFGKEAKNAYDEQTEASAKLAQVMRNTMGARTAEIQSVEDLIDAQERLGVVDGQVQTEAAQELATYLTLSKSIETLLPVMNDMIAQQYGIGASAESAVSIATMMGKVMNGQTSALSRYGYSFTAAQEAILKYGTEEQRAATLAAVVEESVGGMNAALAATPNGRLEQVNFTLGKIKESFGQAVSSIATTFLPVLNGVCSVLANMATLANRVAQSIANVFGQGASAAATAVTYTAGASSEMNDLTASTEAAGDAAKKLGSYGFDTIQKMSSTTSATSGSAQTETGGATVGGGLISESRQETDGAAESVGWLETALARLKQTVSEINFDKLSASLGNLKNSLQPLAESAFQGLKWGYDNVLEPLAKWAGGELAPAFLNSLAAASDVLNAAISALQPMASWLWSNYLQPLASWTGGAVVTILEQITAALNGVSSWINNNQDTFRQITEVIAKFAAIWFVVKTAVSAFNVAMTVLTSPIGVVVAAIAVLVAGIALLVQNWDKVKAAGAAAWEGIKGAWQGACEWFTENITTPISLAWSTVTTALMTLSSQAWEGIKGVWSVVTEWFNTNIFTPIHLAWAIVTTTLMTLSSQAWEGIKGVWSVVTTWFTTNIFTPISTAWSVVTTNLKNWGSQAWESIKNAWSSASSWFSNRVMTPISNGFKGFVNGIIGFFEGLVNGAVNGINTIIRAFNRISFTIPDWVPLIGGKSWGFHLTTVAPVSLPRLADGAVLPGGHPYAAIVNDQKHGTNVETPLATMIEAMMTALNATDFGNDIQVNVRAVFDGQLAALARLLRPYFEADAQRVGRQASTAKGVS